MTTLNQNTKFPASIVWFFIVIAIGGTLAWADLRNRLDRIDHDAMTQSQFREWKEVARQVNSTAYPAFNWPGLPPKD